MCTDCKAPLIIDIQRYHMDFLRRGCAIAVVTIDLEILPSNLFRPSWGTNPNKPCGVLDHYRNKIVWQLVHSRMSELILFLLSIETDGCRKNCKNEQQMPHLDRTLISISIRIMGDTIVSGYQALINWAENTIFSRWVLSAYHKDYKRFETSRSG